MKKTLLVITGILASFILGFYIKTITTKQAETKEKVTPQTVNSKKSKQMKVGAFSVSLNVKDLKTSKEFYENLGFTSFAGGMAQNYLIMKNGNALIGLFQGMFQGNILTFNPGWDENAKELDEFDDVRDIQKKLKSKGIKLSAEADDKTSGPASIMLTDPDGNVILLDQHR